MIQRFTHIIFTIHLDHSTINKKCRNVQLIFVLESDAAFLHRALGSLAALGYTKFGAQSHPTKTKYLHLWNPQEQSRFKTKPASWLGGIQHDKGEGITVYHSITLKNPHTVG